MRILFCLGLVFLIALAQGQNSWQSLDGPPGGFIRVLFHTQNGASFAATQETLFRRKDIMRSWEIVPVPFGHSPIKVIVDSEDKVYVGIDPPADDPSVYFTEDLGDNWSVVPIIKGRAISAMTVNARNQLILGDGTQVLITDDGETGNSVQVAEDANVLDLLADDEGNLLAGTTSGVYRSFDHGETWKPLLNGLPNDIRAWDIDIATTGMITIAADERGVFAAENLAADFQSINMGLEDQIIYTVASDPSGVLFASSDAGYLYKKEMGEEQWMQVNFGTVNKVNGTVDIIVTPQSGLLISQPDYGLMISDPTGTFWQPSNQGLIASAVLDIIELPNQDLIVSTRGGLFRWIDAQSIWQSLLVNNRPWSTRCLLHTSQGQLLACSTSGIVELTISDKTASVTTIALDSVYPIFLQEDTLGNLYVGTFNEGLFYQRENGEWEDVSHPSMGESVITSFDITPSGTILLGTNRDLWKQTHDGWKVVSGPGPPIRDIASSGDLILATAHNSILRSTDDGENWTMHSVSEERPVYTLAIEEDGDAYAGLERDGIYRSTDLGQTWQKFDAGLQVSTVNNLLVGANKLYAGTGEGGVYHQNISTAVNQAGVAQVFPLKFQNPVVDRLNLKLSDIITDAVLFIYSCEGRFLQKNFIGKAQKKMNIDVANLGAGIYLVTLHVSGKMFSGKFIKIN